MFYAPILKKVNLTLPKITQNNPAHLNPRLTKDKLKRLDLDLT